LAHGAPSVHFGMEGLGAQQHFADITSFEF
jgi:hypothetical protein